LQRLTVDEVDLIRLDLALKDSIESLFVTAECEVERLGGHPADRLAIAGLCYELALRLYTEATGKSRSAAIAALHDLGRRS
jgi:hypothetical protein